ncbi:PRC-barrel domain containing protein [Paracoccus methylarcula]|uniref:PRC-barrel domain containing protein n=2 Tax=Paracoccus methylarcula TaxID=72022 RepID=A0A3R7PNL5_9RHOB|nr:PRC-barrel domain containing protein [Paracoccus methylarcula]
MAPDGSSIGSINDLILDGETGEMIAAVIGVGGFLGIGEKQIAVPWEQLTINADAQEVTSDLTKEEADVAPAYVFRERAAAPGAPAGDAMAPADDTMAPADDTMAPADDTMAPADDTTAPADDPAAAPAEGEEPAGN